MSGKGQTGQSMPTASLTSSLLARRGDARPAMRRPTIHQINVRLPAQDDLGWNDMGNDAGGNDQGAADGTASDAPRADVAMVGDASPVQAQINALARRVNAAPPPLSAPPSRTVKSPPASAARQAAAATGPAKTGRAQKPTLDRGVLDHGVAAAVSRVATDAPRKRARKAAFTLRLDHERHLRLRLLSAVSSRSAQQLVVDALDAMIAADPNIEKLVDQVEAVTQGPPAPSKRGA